jgi:hypothetical protein
MSANVAKVAETGVFAAIGVVASCALSGPFARTIRGPLRAAD